MCNRATQNSIFVPVLDVQYMLLCVGSLYMPWIPKYFKISAVTEWWPKSYEEGSEISGLSIFGMSVHVSLGLYPVLYASEIIVESSVSLIQYIMFFYSL